MSVRLNPSRPILRNSPQRPEPHVKNLTGKGPQPALRIDRAAEDAYLDSDMMLRGEAVEPSAGRIQWPQPEMRNLTTCKVYIGITNWAIRNTTSNFNVQAQSLDDLAAVWKRTQEHYPWLVAVENDHVLAYALASRYKARAA